MLKEHLKSLKMDIIAGCKVNSDFLFCHYLLCLFLFLSQLQKNEKSCSLLNCKKSADD